MANCLKCEKLKNCPWSLDPEVICSAYQQKPMTNADRIRVMSDEELAKLIYSDWCDIACSPETQNCNMDCIDKILDWLRREVKE